MWCSHIYGPFRKIFEENPEIFSKNGYIHMYAKFYEDEKTEMKHLQLELSSQSTSHLEKDKLASVLYDYDSYLTGYKAYFLAKVIVTKNTIPNTLNFKPACISPVRQEIIPLTSYQLLNCKSDIGEIFILSQYAKQPKESDEELTDITSRILDFLNDLWNNPAFSSKFAKSQNKGTYITNVIVPTIQIILKGLSLERSSYVSSAKCQSSTSADRKDKGLSDSLIKRAYQGLLNYSKNPVLLEMISGKPSQIKSYLKHKLEVYENSLNRKCKNPEALKHVHEEDNNR
ncbi:hypothetical protein C1645_825656 [Glomus cerebriforme]|uniref:Uncharacterized protein n=1 Tax=Glomus cerebriforme TaxID=658196 RepID=A0A397SRY2_9GLOM|nr:hypothetical protein C1645_825656 [Glomus cerebriforme]